MSSHRIEELLRKSLLGQLEELANTQFHLFSRRSRATGRVVDCRVLCANNVLLTESTKYFSNLLSSDTDPSDPSLSNVAENDEILSGIPMGDYGYESDSDLDDDDDEGTATESVGGGVASKGDNEPSDNASESSDSDTFLSDAGDDVESDATLFVADKGKSDTGTETTATIRATSTRSDNTTRSNATRLQLTGSRHILVKDTAFQTWYALLNYLYTGKVVFLPPRSLGGRSECQTSPNTAEEPKCSAKSMYRLACKVGIDALRDLAFASVRSSLTEDNILTELACRLPSRYPPILEMELDILHEHIASPTIKTGLSSFVRRIANKELLHGADIINGLHTRIFAVNDPRVLSPPSPPFKEMDRVLDHPVPPLPSLFGSPRRSPLSSDIVPLPSTPTPAATAETDWGCPAPASPPSKLDRRRFKRRVR